MTTKKQKRAAGEAKAKREAEERRQSGLAAQRAEREARAQREKRMDDAAQEINQRHRSVLLIHGIDPSTGNRFKNNEDAKRYKAEADKRWEQTKPGFDRLALLWKGYNPTTKVLFTDEEMAEMERKADTPERRHTFERIQAGRAAALNEQPPLGGIDDYLDPIPGEEMTVGEFRDKMDQMTEAWVNRMQAKRDERFPARFMETQAALRAATSPDREEYEDMRPKPNMEEALNSALFPERIVRRPELTPKFLTAEEAATLSIDERASLRFTGLENERE